MEGVCAMGKKVGAMQEREKRRKMRNKISFSYHLVEISPYPLTSSICLLTLLLSFVGKIHIINNIGIQEKINKIIIIALISLIISVYLWFKDIISEAYYRGEHTTKVQSSINLGFGLFVISEACIFFSLFFAYFYNSLIPSVEIGSIWPPTGIITLNYKAIPLINTAILFFSGVAITASHNYLISNNKSLALFYLFLTIFLGSIFSAFQYYEYLNAFFTLTDSFFGSSFFLLTGFHAFHILCGTLFLLIAFLRLNYNQFIISHHLNFSLGSLYWHFVDLVWLFLFAFLYIWASN